MKTKVSFLTKVMTVALVAMMTTTVAFADGETTDLFATGTTNTPAGDFVVRSTSDVFHYQGNEYEVFKVYYDNPTVNMKIAVNKEGKCKSFIAYTKEYTMFYSCTKHGFGVRKVLFTNPTAQEKFDHEKYQDQTILVKKRKIDKKKAVELIAAYLPGMQKL